MWDHHLTRHRIYVHVDFTSPKKSVTLDVHIYNWQSCVVLRWRYNKPDSDWFVDRRLTSACFQFGENFRFHSAVLSYPLSLILSEHDLYISALLGVFSSWLFLSFSLLLSPGATAAHICTYSGSFSSSMTAHCLNFLSFVQKSEPSQKLFPNC